jgi:hypothetical protein
MHNGSARDHLRQELAAARAALARDAHAAVADAHTLADWRHHFRTHPWLCCGGAALLGYALVPARRTVTFPTGLEPLSSAIADPSTSEQAQGATKGAIATLLGIGGTFLARQALNYATRRGLQYLQARSSSPRSPQAWQYGSMASGEPEDYAND